MSSFRLFLSSLVLAVPAALPAQATPSPADGTTARAQEIHGLPGRAPGTERWLVQFTARSFDLRELRSALWSGRPAAESAALVEKYQRLVKSDQAPFVEAVAKLGGTVVAQWWVVNACAVEIAPAQLGALRQLPGVLRMHPDEEVVPLILKATSSANHNSDAVNANGYRGLGVVAAIVDTGQDENMGGTGKPHQTYYPGGNKLLPSRLILNRQIGAQPADDVHGHGTGVAGIAVGGKWSSSGADDGHAPLADIAGYAIADTTSGNSNYTTITSAWQAVLADKANGRKIVSANNSYSGSPDPLNTSQQALDACALNGDVMVCVAAGNSSSSTASSQACVNGLAVAAVNPDSHTVATFSSRGPLSGDTQRFYPDIAACGVSTVMPLRNNETSNYVGSGTSMASPQVCGAATLLRGAVTSLKADETKAILLAAALDISAKNPSAPYNTRNAYGMGLSKDDQAMVVAQDANAHGRAAVSTTTKTWTKPLVLTPNKTYRIAISWMRQATTTTLWSNLDLEILDGTTVVASSNTPRNLYELAAFRASKPVYTMRVTATSLEGANQDFGWALSEGVAPPIVGTFTAYGAGCKGTGSGGGGPVCVSLNPTETANGTLSFVASRLFAHEVKAPTNLSVTGFEFLCSASAPITVNTYLYLSAGTMPAATPVRTSTMQVGTTSQFCQSSFPAYPIPMGATFYIVYQTPASGAFYVNTNSGSTGTYYWNGPSWSGPWTSYKFAWKVNCGSSSGGAIPVLSSASIPEIGKTLNLDLGFARKSSAAALFIGGSKSVWMSVPLPLDLTPFGAPSCSILASGDLVLPTPTDSSGGASVPLPIPNEKALVGVLFYNQYMILDPPANNLGLVFTNGGEAKIGGQP